MRRVVLSACLLAMPCAYMGTVVPCPEAAAGTAAEAETDEIAVIYRSMQLEGVVNWKAFRQAVAGYGFREVYVAEAGCTISSHCGPNTLGVLFLKQ